MRSFPRVAFALFCVWLASPCIDRVVGWLGGQNWWGPRDTIASALLASGPAIVLALAALASARSDAGLALAGGLVVGVTGDWQLAPFGIVATLMALALGRPWTWALARERLPLAGLGMLAGLCLCGLTTDLAMTVAPPTYEHLRVWAPDPVDERVLRVSFELATLGAAIAFARGRTWAALVLVPLALGLVRSAAVHGPRWGGGCLSFGHPLVGSLSLVLVPTLVAVVPWAAPIARALRRLA
jgi:hypothetical protein